MYTWSQLVHNHPVLCTPYIHKYIDAPSFSQATERSGIASAANSFKENLRADEGAPYDEVIEIDLNKLRPHVNGPFTPDLAHPVGAEFSAAVKVSQSIWYVQIFQKLRPCEL